MKFMLLIPVIFFVNACSVKSLKQASAIDEKGRVRLSLVPKVGDLEVTKYASRGITRIYKGELLEKKEKDMNSSRDS